MSDGPPRGISTSTESRCCMKVTAAARLVSSTRIRESSGSPASANAARSTRAMAMFELMAPDEPRRNAALPDLRHSPAASEVTFGRFS